MINKLIERNTPQWAELFATEILPVREDGKNYYTIEKQGDKVLLGGDCVNSLAAAYGRFLRDFCRAAFDRERRVTTFNESPIMPNDKIECVITAKIRAAFDYPMFSYEAVTWDRERWEREIDFIAMNGANMPLSVVGTEAVMKEALVEIGLPEPAAIAALSGPSFWSWQLLNCFDGYLPHVRGDYPDRRLELGRWIIERETQLGMTPIMQGFSGYIVRTIIKVNRHIRMTSVGGWRRFAQQYQIAVRDPMFRRLGMAFLKKQRLLLGGSSYFCADPFFGHSPLKGSEAFFAGFGTAEYKLCEAFDENSVWVMHASSAADGILKIVPQGKLLILDDSGKGDFYGHNYVSVVSSNEDGVTSWYGSLNALTDSSSEEDEACVGNGVFCGSGETNMAFSDFAFEMLTADKKPDVVAWLAENMKCRYGSDDEKISKAASLLCESCYSDNSPKREYASILAMRPTVLPQHTSIGDSGVVANYDFHMLIEAAELLLDTKAESREMELDICEILLQGISLAATKLCLAAIDGYKSKDVAAFEKNTNLFLEAFEDADRLASTKKELTVTYRLERIREIGSENDEKQNFEINLLSQITLWGPMKDTELYDTAWRLWSGLIGTYYQKRWRALFEQLAQNFKKLRRFPEKTKNRIDGRDEYLGSDFGRALATVEKDWVASFNPNEHPYEKEKTPDVARELCKKYSAYSSN